MSAVAAPIYPAFRWASWHTHPEVLVLCATLLIAYFVAIRELRPDGEAPATFAQKRNWVLAILTLLVAAEWPVHDLAEGYLYSVHMLQHIALTMFLPPLILTALPAWLFKQIVPARAMRFVRWVCRPFVALVFFNVVLVFTHWPNMVRASIVGTGHEWIHFGLHVLLVFSALAMWMPLLSPVIEIPRLSLPGQIIYLFLQSIVPVVPASFLTFGARPLYPVYQLFPKPWGISAIADQRTAGLMMKLLGSAILWAFMSKIFFKWYHQEHDDGIDAIAMRDVDRALNRMELSR